MITEYFIPIALGVSLSACCGFRVFVPLLIASLAAKFNYLPLSDGFAWMNSWTAVICFGAASVVEILAYYIPVVDILLDALTTPSAVIAGTVISASVFTDIDPMLKWSLALIAGGGTAGIVQAGTGLLRLGSTKLTAGTGNAVVSTGENVMSVVGSLLSLLMPVFMFILVGGLVVGSIYLLLRKIMKSVSPKSGS